MLGFVREEDCLHLTMSKATNYSLYAAVKIISVKSADVEHYVPYVYAFFVEIVILTD